MVNETLDLDILNVLKKKENYDNYYALVEFDVLCEEAKIILKGYEEYYKEHNEDINYTKFVPWFINTLHRNWLPEDVNYYKAIFKNITKLTKADVESTLTRMKQEKLWQQLTHIKDTTFNLKDMKDVIDKNELGIANTNKAIQYLSYDEAFKEDEITSGYKWRLKELNDNWGAIKKQQLYLVMATTHTGKSSFVTSEALYFMSQLHGKSILYFNNERSEKAVFERFMSGLFRKSVDQIRANLQSVRLSFEKHYPNEVLKIFSARNAKRSIKEIEAACALYNPGIVVIDQLDKLVGEKDKLSRRPYEKIYAWARDLAVKYDTPVIGVTQYGVSVDSNGNVINKKMHQHGSFDAKIDKAANTDYLLGIQNVDDENTTKRIYLIRAKEGKENVSFICKFNRDIGLFENY